MTEVKYGAWAMIASAILTMLVFAFHPAHVAGQPLLGPFTLSQLVHGTALVAVPLMAFGLWQFGEWLGLDRAIVRLAVLLSFLAAATTINAAVISNFVTPVAARAAMPGHGRPAVAPAAAHPQRSVHEAARPHVMPPLVAMSVAMNRGFAQVHVAFLSIALLLFGLAIRSRSAVLGWSGAAVGSFPILWQLSGQFAPSTHSMPIIVFPQSIWMIAAAVSMLRAAKAA